MVDSKNKSRSSLSTENWQKAILGENVIIRDVINNLDDNGLQIVMIVDEQGKLLGTLSDGDIRRALLKGMNIDSPVESIVFRNPLVAPQSLNLKHVIQLMTVNKIRQIPIVDDEHRIIGLHLWDDLALPVERKNTMVIMAGGRGTRMHPRTANCPKPMLHVGGKPMLEHIIHRAKEEGFRRFIIAVHYLGHLIENYFTDGRDMGVSIEYLREEAPLGTAGALSLIRAELEEPIVITNGDVMTDIRYGELIDFHQESAADATMAVRLHEWQHRFGVVELDGIKISDIREKPISCVNINAGVYVLSPHVLKHLEFGETCDMPKLFRRVIEQGQRAVAYPMHESWADIGRPGDLDRANSIARDDEAGGR